MPKRDQVVVLSESADPVFYSCGCVAEQVGDGPFNFLSGCSEAGCCVRAAHSSRSELPRSGYVSLVYSNRGNGLSDLPREIRIRDVDPR